MHPILLKLGPFTIYSYGVIVALGFATATFLIYKKAGRFGIDKNKILDLVIIILVAGVIGARIIYISMNLGYYLRTPLEIIDLSKGGLVWYGGFILGLFAMFWYVVRNNIDFWNIADLIAPYLALAHALGRIGCFLNGCCYGIEVAPGYPIAVQFPGEHVFRCPTEIYSSITLLLIFIILRIWQEKRHFSGEVSLAYGVLYSLKRFCIEFLRGDNPKVLCGLTMSQVISLVILVVSLILFIYRALAWRKRT